MKKLLSLLLVICFLISCGGSQETPAPPAEESPPSGADEGGQEVPEESPTPLHLDQPAASPDSSERVAASHILVKWRESAKANNTVKRTRAEARERAEDIRRRALAGEDFGELAREYSECPTGRHGGFLGGFGRGAMQKDFEDAVFALEVGEIGPLTETPFGFHIIRREELLEFHVAHILVQWQGIPRSEATRSKEEALARIHEAQERLAAGEPFADVARAYSDGAMGERGGDLGWFTRGQFLPDFEEAALALQPGETSDVLETVAGFHIIRRLE